MNCQANLNGPKNVQKKQHCDILYVILMLKTTVGEFGYIHLDIAHITLRRRIGVANGRIQPEQTPNG